MLRNVLPRLSVLLLLSLPCALPALAEDAETASAAPRVELVTSSGKIVIELAPNEAPITVENFLAYVESGHFDGTIFHRVIPGFMVQGGGFTADLVEKPTRDPIKNEAKNGLSNDRGTIAMARRRSPDSATAQFFINVVDNGSLNPGGVDPWGYTVFGKVVEGMDVADAIVGVPTTRKGPHTNVPAEPIVIEKAHVIPGQAADEGGE